MTLMLQDKIALVTGASRGIGQAIALELGRHGATVLGTATTDQGAQNIDALLAQHAIIGGIVLNVNDQAAIDNLMSRLNEQWGLPTLLINNAGITRDNMLLRMKAQEWDDVLFTNLRAVYSLSKACIKGMLKANWGRIINISSVVGLTGNAGQANYAAAKAGLIGFTKSVAQELASRAITVNAVAPGFIDTDMTVKLSDSQKELILQKVPMGRLGKVDEVAAVVAFLASPLASYVTGETIHVNGGMYMG